MKLLIQPGAGVAALVKGIEKAQKSVEIIIFRFAVRMRYQAAKLSTGQHKVSGKSVKRTQTIGSLHQGSS